jgi:MFS family permease
MYLLSQIIFALSGMAIGFLVVHSVQTWDLTDAEAGGYTIALQVGLTLAYLFFGFLSDRRGHKLSLEISLAVSVLLHRSTLSHCAQARLGVFLRFAVQWGRTPSKETPRCRNTNRMR